MDQSINKTLSRVIEVDEARRGGVPVFRGTDVPLKSLFEHLHAGGSLESFLADSRGVSHAQARVVLDLASHYLLRALFER